MYLAAILTQEYSVQSAASSRMAKMVWGPGKLEGCEWKGYVEAMYNVSNLRSSKHEDSKSAPACPPNLATHKCAEIDGVVWLHSTVRTAGKWGTLVGRSCHFHEWQVHTCHHCSRSAICQVGRSH